MLKRKKLSIVVPSNYISGSNSDSDENNLLKEKHTMFITNKYQPTCRNMNESTFYDIVDSYAENNHINFNFILRSLGEDLTSFYTDKRIQSMLPSAILSERYEFAYTILCNLPEINSVYFTKENRQAILDSADPENKHIERALHIAVKNLDCPIDIINLLIYMGADTKSPTIFWETPMVYLNRYRVRNTRSKLIIKEHLENGLSTEARANCKEKIKFYNIKFSEEAKRTNQTSRSYRAKKPYCK